MTDAIVGVLSPQEGISLGLKILAVIGGATLGGLLVGALGGLLARSLTTRPLPVWSRRTLRLLGAVAAGWLVAFFVFRGQGGWGFGGPGGGSEGGETANKDRSSDKDDRSTQTKDEKKASEKNPPKEDLVVVEILGEATLKELGKFRTDVYQGFRIKGEQKNLYTKVDLVEELRKRRKRMPGLKVQLKSYTGSPVSSLNDVPALRKWLDDEEMLVKEQPK
jgi:hypothetical protein